MKKQIKKIITNSLFLLLCHLLVIISTLSMTVTTEAAVTLELLFPNKEMSIDIDTDINELNEDQNNTDEKIINTQIFNCIIDPILINSTTIKSIVVDSNDLMQIKAVKDYERQLQLEKEQEEARRQAEIAAEEARKQATGANNYASTTYYGNCRITHYCNCSICCGKWAGGGTASGAWPSAGRTVANGDLPFGTKLLINGQIYVVEDRGVGAQQIDIYCNSHEEALSRGMYYTDVYIINE